MATALYGSEEVHRTLVQVQSGQEVEDEEVLHVANVLDGYFRFEPTARALADFEQRAWQDCPVGTPRTLTRMREVHYRKLRMISQILQPLSETRVWEAVSRSMTKAFDRLEAVAAVLCSSEEAHVSTGLAAAGEDDEAVEAPAPPVDIDDDMTKSAVKQDQYYRALLQAMNKEELALHGGRVYAKVWTGEGVSRRFTHCYAPLPQTSVEMLVSTYSQQVISKPHLYAMALQANEDRAIKYLTRADPTRVEGVTVYAPKRHLFSCRDGVLTVGEPIRLIPWSEVEPGTQTSNFFDIEAGPLIDQLSTLTTSMDTSAILPTPAIDRILETQGIEPESELYRCFLALCIGRLCHTMRTGHNEGEADVFGDAWQIVPVLVGKGGTGKSSIVENFLMKIYGRSNVAVVGEGTEAKYLLDVFEGKLMWVAAEVGDSFPLGQQVFQQIVSNETVTIRKIFGTQKPFTFDMPGFMSSNTGLPYVDREQSQKRRLVPFPFLRAVPVQNQDPSVGAGLRDKGQFMRLLIKANMCYHWLKKRVQQEAGGRFHEWLRKNCDESGHYFLMGQMKTLARKDTLVAFLNDACFESKTLVIDPGSQRDERTYYISFDDLQEMGNDWQQRNHMERITWDATNVANTVALLDAVWSRGERLYPPGEGGSLEDKVYILGLAKRSHVGQDVNWTVLRRRWLVQATVVVLSNDGAGSVLDSVSLFWTVDSEGAFRRFKALPRHASQGDEGFEECLEDFETAWDKHEEHQNKDPSQALMKSCEGMSIHRVLYYTKPRDDDDDDDDGDSQMTPL